MAKEKGRYTRRLSLDEARESYILISKDALSLFPPPGETFKATLNGEDVELKVEAVPCTCRGPDKPHDHHHLSLGTAGAALRLRRGTVARITKDGEGYRIGIG